MSVNTFYRLAIWFPLALPAVTAMLVHGLGYRPEPPLFKKAVQLLLMTLVYGGISYMPLALFATFWIGGRSEREITRVAVRAPLFLIVIFAMLSLVLLSLSGSVEMSVTFALLGSLMSVVVGYGCVAVVFACRLLLGTKGVLPTFVRQR